MPLFHIIYTSSACNPLSLSQLRQLLSVSRERNYRLRLTGLLLYHHERFMQVLEGPEPAVKKVFASIERDSRHHGIDVLRFEAKDKRNFPDWRMGFRNFAISVESLPFVSSFLDPDYDARPLQDDASEAYCMLLEFRDAEDR